MKYYSEKTNKLYDNADDLKSAEKDFDKRQAAEKEKRDMRTKRAKEVENAYKAYTQLLNDFIKDYGSYHTTITSNDGFTQLLNWLF